MANVAVFCGSSSGVDPVYAAVARAFGEALARRGHRLVFGGGRVGLMGIVADTVLAHGGEAIGVIPAFLEEAEVAHEGLTRLEVVPSMHARKARMAELADAFVTLPGGFGTLDETFEILTWKQLGLHDRPIVLLDVAGVWAPFLRLTEGLISEGFVKPSHAALFTVAQSPGEALGLVEHAPRVSGSIASKLV
jgi:uncharacterized protein (TIGR00730 family)